MNDIIVQPTGGLCNRLRTIFSWREYCLSYNKKLIILWNKDKFCQGYFNNYFIEPTDCEFIYDDIVPDRHITYSGCYKHTDIQNNKSIYRDLQLKEPILKEIEIYKKQFGQYNAVHIRRTDHTTLAEKNNKLTSDSMFMDFIKQSTLKVFIASDNLESLKYYQGIFLNKVHIHNKIFEQNNFRQTSLRDAVIDLFLCIGSVNFLGSGWSSFTDFINVMRKQ